MTPPSDTQAIIEDLLTFINTSPTAFHAVDWIKIKLEQSGFSELKESALWDLKPNGKYFTIRNGTSICAFIVPNKNLGKAKIIGSHTDSPAFKIKPNGEFRRENMTMLGVEIYGAPLLNSWLNRDLGIAGHVYYFDREGKQKDTLINIRDKPVAIPQLAVHLDRSVNENGLLLNKQEHLCALAGTDLEGSFLYKAFKECIHDIAGLISYDLYLYPLELAKRIGAKGELISAYRIDSLNSVHACLNALIEESHTEHPDELNVAVFWDNEEVGSLSAQGASSPFLPQILERIALGLKLSREDYLCMLARSFCVSVDLAHAVHPNYNEKHEPMHRPLLNRGIVIKSNAQSRYATTAATAAPIIELCIKKKVPFQHFVARNDMPCGTTIGPLQAGLTGISTIDIGCPQLSMHSVREIAGLDDHVHMCNLLKAFLSTKLS